MIDATLVKRLPHFVPLAVLKQLSTLSGAPEATPYLDSEDLAAIKSMGLLNRGRLSVQPVTTDAWKAIIKLGERGGWDGKLSTISGPSKRKREEEAKKDGIVPARPRNKAKTNNDRKEGDASSSVVLPTRRSTRTRKI
jgi:hypothetical protein